MTIHPGYRSGDPGDRTQEIAADRRTANQARFFDSVGRLRIYEHPRLIVLGPARIRYWQRALA